MSGGEAQWLALHVQGLGFNSYYWKQNKGKQKKQTFLGVLLRQMIMLEAERQIGVGLSFPNTSGLMINSKVM